MNFSRLLFLCFVRKRTQIIALGLQMMIGTHSQPPSTISSIHLERTSLALCPAITVQHSVHVFNVWEAKQKWNEFVLCQSNVNASIYLFIYLRYSILLLIVCGCVYLWRITPSPKEQQRKWTGPMIYPLHTLRENAVFHLFGIIKSAAHPNVCLFQLKYALSSST